MGAFDLPEWAAIFAPDAPLLGSFVRGSVVYLALIVLFRVVLRRQTGSIGLPDIMLVVLLSECVSSALSAEAKSVPNGLVAVFALLFWSYALDRLGNRWPWFQRLLEPPPLALVRDGRPVRAHLDREGITGDELMAQVRAGGVDDLTRVKLATLESDGSVSVVERDPGDPPARASKAARAADAVVDPAGPPGFDAAVKTFLAAAARVQEAVAWHEERATEHKAAARAARDLLARHGVRTARTPPPTRTENPAQESTP
ncbi:DUF421 domain-containing protein [Gemmata sp.]|uniref:DUF421 domain-containing protein n=1 Tax=Gemmata sp. TaxID=1914242 RepID=UPI003F711E30